MTTDRNVPDSTDNTSPAAWTPAVRWLRQHLPHIALVLGATGVAALLGYGLTLSLLPLLGGQAALAGAAVGGLLTAIGLPVALWMRVPQQAYLRLLRQQGVADAAARGQGANRPAAGDGGASADGFSTSRTQGAVVTRLRPVPAERNAATAAQGSVPGADARSAVSARRALSPAAAASAAMPSAAARASADSDGVDLSLPLRVDDRRQGAQPGAQSGGGQPRAPRPDEFPVFKPLGLGDAAGGGMTTPKHADAGAEPAMAGLPDLPAIPDGVSLAAVAGLAGGLGQPMAEGISEAQRSVRDALTGAYTQQHFVAAADREWSRSRRHGEDAALLMVDIDRFKGINDRFGNGCGDALLVEVTRQVSNTLRQYDLMARFGGGVLVVYLPQTDPIGALDVAERIRERIATLRVHWEQHTVRSTVSVGVAGIGASHGALDEVIADAGTALRDAKAAGRNCVRAAPIPPRRRADSFPVGSQRPLGPL